MPGRHPRVEASLPAEAAGEAGLRTSKRNLRASSHLELAYLGSAYCDTAYDLRLRRTEGRRTGERLTLGAGHGAPCAGWIVRRTGWGASDRVTGWARNGASWCLAPDRNRRGRTED